MKTEANVLFVGFKGINNSSALLVDQLSSHKFLLTNSFTGLKKDIGSLPAEYDAVYLFGADKNLTDSFRIEKYAERNGIQLSTILDTEDIRKKLTQAGITSTISTEPTHYLCNEAYWWLLEKYKGKAVLIHIPTIKHFDAKKYFCLRF